jgi:FG-GAP-like repeat
MRKLNFHHIVRLLFKAGILPVVVLCGFLLQQVHAGCTPIYYRDMSRKVYRSNKIFFEGLADINGDGKPDAYGYELQSNGAYRNIVYVLNNGKGGFGDPIIINTSFNISTKDGEDRGVHLDHTYNSVTVGDLNNDGKLDFIVRGTFGDSEPEKRIFHAISSSPGGAYAETGSWTGFWYDHISDIADLNGDDRGDVIINWFQAFWPGNGPTTNAIYFRLANGDGSFASQLPLGGLRELISPVVDDFDGDGKVDIAYTYWGALPGEGSAYHLRVLINNGSAVFSDRPLLPHVDAFTAGKTDLNGDGKKDLYGGALFVNDGSGRFTRSSLPTNPDPDFPTGFINNKGQSHLMDYDGDGNQDIVITVNAQQSAQGMIKRYHDVYFNDGLGNITKAIIKRPFIGTPADINGDGKDEEVIFVNSNPTTQPQFGAPYLRVSPTNETAIIVRENVCTQPPVKGQNKLVDFGGDGISDIALWKPGTGDWRYITNLYENTVAWGKGAMGDIPIPGDYDGDGRTDHAVFRNGTGDWWTLRSSDNTFTAMHFGLAGDIPIPGDYNNDGKADVAVFRPSNGDWYIAYTGTDQFTFLHFGATGDIPIPGDFDGDGSDNIAVYRPSSGEWFYLTSTFDNYVGLRWGMTGDIPIPGDYDMDGKADLAVFRPNGHQWFIFRSSDNSMSYVKFGEDGDTPMLVDTDGDGVMELSTYRTHSSTPTDWLSSNQPSFAWGSYGTSDERPLRRLLPNN